jgi:hypothetical protein
MLATFRGHAATAPPPSPHPLFSHYRATTPLTPQDLFQTALQDSRRQRERAAAADLIRRHALEEALLGRRKHTPGPGAYTLPTSGRVGPGVVPFSATNVKNVMELDMRPTPGPGAYIDPAFRPSSSGVIIGQGPRASLGFPAARYS